MREATGPCGAGSTSSSAFLPQQIPGRAAQADHRARGVGRDALLPASWRGRGAAGSTTTRSGGSCARATTSPSAARPGRHRRRSGRSSPTMCASSRACGTRPPTRSATGTGSRCRLRPRRWTRTKLFATLDEADARDGRAVRALEGRPRRASRGTVRLPAAELAPWHYADPFFQEVPAEGGVDLDPFLAGADVVALLASGPSTGSGSRPASVLDRSDLFPRDGKCQHAFCIDIDRAGRHPGARERRPRPASGWTRCCTSSATRRSTRGIDPVAARGCCATRTSSSPRGSRS